MVALTTWRSCPVQQQPHYADLTALENIINKITYLPPLVASAEVDRLSDLLAAAGRGEIFLLQGGDCAETFVDSSPARIRAKMQTLLQMAFILACGTSLPVATVGRIAGQYAKPRSHASEIRNGIELPSYRGDAVNGFAFTKASRSPDPERLLEAYRHADTTLRFIKSFLEDAQQNWQDVYDWKNEFFSDPAYSRHKKLLSEIEKIFSRQGNGDAGTLREQTRFYTAHEALLLPYEEALSRAQKDTDKIYNTGAHFLWIGDRTRALTGAHVEMLSHIENPLGVKIGPSATAEELLALIDKLNPENKPGRLTLITRLGAEKIFSLLPSLIEAVRREGKEVIWVSDPMHGNTIVAKNGYKTRRMQDILKEVAAFFQIHKQAGTIPAGIHIELTSDDVTEVLGGAENIKEDLLATRYEALVDPRLNRRQSLEVAFSVAEIFREFSSIPLL